MDFVVFVIVTGEKKNQMSHHILVELYNYVMSLLVAVDHQCLFLKRLQILTIVLVESHLHGPS